MDDVENSTCGRDVAGRFARVVGSRLLIPGSRKRIRKSAPPHLWRVVALFFLALTFSELVFAGTCGPELLGLPPDIANHVFPSDEYGADADCVELISATNETPHDHSGEGGCSTEDCFCCCSNITVAAPYSVAANELARPASEPARTSLPSGPSSSLFRPPRSL